MAHDDWRPDVDVPRDYPPPQRPAGLWEQLAAQRSGSLHPGGPPSERPAFDPRDGLRRCLADVEASAQRLRAMIERLGP
jgi:hypothetical protein